MGQEQRSDNSKAARRMEPLGLDDIGGACMPPTLSNLAVRDVETLIHPYTQLARFRETGPLVLERGRGVYVYDSDGKEDSEP